MENFKNCYKCGAVCDSEFKFCPNCGTNLEERKCLKCGAKLIEGAKFCVNCGASLLDEQENPVEEQTNESESVNSTEEEIEVFNEEIENSFEDEEEYFDVKPISKPVKKPAKANTGKSNYIIRLVKNLSVFVLCLIMFALSFCDIVSVDTETYIEEIPDYEFSVSAVDVIELMGSTASSRKAHNKYEDELTDLTGRLYEALQNDYNDRLDKFILSSKTKKLIDEIALCSIKCELSDEEYKGSSIYNNIIISGVFCLANIGFSFAMLIVSIISVLSVVLRKKNKVSKFLYAMPVFLFMSLIILFLVKTTAGVGVGVAGAMGANLFFGIVALITAIVLVFSASKKKDLSVAIPKLVTVAVVLIVCACMFAPVFTAKYDAVLQNTRYEDTYSVSVDAGGLITYLSPNEIKELESITPGNVYHTYMRLVNQTLESLSEMTPYEFNEIGGEICTRMIMDYIVKAEGDYNLVGVLSAGYYMLIPIFMILCECVVMAVATLFKRSNKSLSSLVVAIIIMAIALSCSVGWICVMNYNLDGYNCDFTVGGALIAGVVLLIMATLIEPVADSVVQRQRKAKVQQELQYDTDFE